MDARLVSDCFPFSTRMESVNEHFSKFDKFKDEFFDHARNETIISSIDLEDHFSTLNLLRSQYKHDILDEISRNSAIYASIDINSLFKRHVSDLKIEFQSGLSEQFQNHKKLIKDLIDTNGQERRTW